MHPQNASFIFLSLNLFLQLMGPLWPMLSEDPLSMKTLMTGLIERKCQITMLNRSSTKISNDTNLQMLKKPLMKF